MLYTFSDTLQILKIKKVYFGDPGSVPTHVARVMILASGVNRVDILRVLRGRKNIYFETYASLKAPIKMAFWSYHMYT